jgi:hypothetical protein
MISVAAPWPILAFVISIFKRTLGFCACDAWGQADRQEHQRANSEQYSPLNIDCGFTDQQPAFNIS